MNPSPESDAVDALRHLDACIVANAIESFHTRLRNEGFMDGSVRSIFSALPPMAGHAVTLKIRGASPPTAGQPYVEDTAWWNHILQIPAPRVLVVQDISSKPGLGSLLGEVHVNILRALECVGAVTNGSVRDIQAVQALDFPLFAGNVGISHSYIHIVEVGVPVTVGGLTVAPGDLLHGDLHGVQTVPKDIAPKIPARARELRKREREIIEICRSPNFSIEKLRKALAP